ncbi:MAG: SPFH domain-containing protein [Xanthomonadales bacterium]|nr:SPFH domain-containing protein [Xanthomonadales bacterium]
MITEIDRKAMSGYPMLLVLFVLSIGSIAAIITFGKADSMLLMVASMVVLLVVLVCWGGFFMVHPNESKVLQLFGQYAGTAKDAGLRWANPFLSKTAVSTRVRNFESSALKVNDSVGNPIEIASVVVWRVIDSAEAIFEVDDYESFVRIQTEAALRNMASAHPYEAHQGEEIALRSSPAEIAEFLKIEVQDRLQKAGVEVIESRISHLAYAQEIASAMLKRQQAQAIVAARSTIVEGAVGMVKMALDELKSLDVVDLDEERKAAMVSNLLVVLCGEENAQPIINSGSLYS